MTDVSLRVLEREVMAQYGVSGDVDRGLLTRYVQARARAGEDRTPPFLAQLENQAIEEMRRTREFSVTSRYVSLMNKAGLSVVSEIERLLTALNRFELRAKGARQVRLEHVYGLLLPHWSWDNGVVATWWSGTMPRVLCLRHDGVVTDGELNPLPQPLAERVVPLLWSAWHTNGRSLSDTMTLGIATTPQGDGSEWPPAAMFAFAPADAAGSPETGRPDMNAMGTEIGRIELSGHQMIHLLLRYELLTHGDPSLIPDESEPDFEPAVVQMLKAESRKRRGWTFDLDDVKRVAALAIATAEASTDAPFGAAVAVRGLGGFSDVAIVAVRASVEATEASALRAVDDAKFRAEALRRSENREKTSLVVAVVSGDEVAISVGSVTVEYHFRTAGPVFTLQRFTDTSGLGRPGLDRWVRSPGPNRVRLSLEAAKEWATRPETTMRNPSDLPLVPLGRTGDNLPAIPVATLPPHEWRPPRVSFDLMLSGAVPFAYLPEGAHEHPPITTALGRLLTRQGIADVNAWEDLLAQCGSTRAKLYVVDRTGERWQVVGVEFDYGGDTGQLVVRHLGPRSRGGDLRVDIHQAFGRMLPVVVYSSTRRNSLDGLRHRPEILSVEARTNPRRNSDADLRDLERRWRASGADEDRRRYFVSAARAGRLTAREERAFRIAEHGRRPSNFEKFVSWDYLYELLRTPRTARARPSLENDCQRWGLQATGDSGQVEATINEFESQNGVTLDDDQRDAVRFLWERVHENACRAAEIAGMRRLVPVIVRLVNDASASGGACEEELDERRIPRSSPLPGGRRAIMGWREGIRPPGKNEVLEQDGVWFRVARPFLRAYIEGLFWVGGSCRVALDRVETRLRRLDGDDVVLAAMRFGDSIGERPTLRGDDAESFVEFPTAEDIRGAILQAGPLKAGDD